MAAIDNQTPADPSNHPEFARAVFEAANDAIFVIDPAQDRIVDANPKACALLGYDRRELLNTPISVIHPQEMLELLYFARSVLETGSGWTDRLSCLTKSGERLPAEFSASSIVIDGTTCLIIIIRPIQQHTRQLLEELFSETAALTGEAFLHSLVTNLANALRVRHALIATLPDADRPEHSLGLWWDGTQVSPFTPRFPGTPSARVVTGEVVHHPDDLPQLYPELKQRAPGVVSYLGFPLRASSGEILGLIAVFDNKPMPAIPLELSIFRLFAERARAELERSRFEQALLIEKRTAENANRAKSEFLANLSHELRTPLNGVLGYAQILRKADNLSTEQQDAVSIIQRSGEHLLNLINDLLDLSQIESETLDTRSDTFLFRAFLELLVDMIRIRAEARGLSVIFEPAAGLPVAVLGDEKRLRQILINLLGNAVKFTDHGSIRFRVEHRDGTAHFEITDTGIGIPEAQIETIFQPFQRLTETDAHSREGAGLGLAICQRLLKALDGELRVRSQVGAGSVFTVTVPLPIASDFAPNGQAPPEPEIVGYRGPRRRILVVDDRRDNRLLLWRILEPLGFILDEAVDGEQAVRRVRDQQPDLILMDLVMPVMDGFEATRRIRAMPELEKIIIIGLSASVFEENQRGSLNAGCDDFIGKPIRSEELLHGLRTHLQLEWDYRSVALPDAEPAPADPPSVPVDIPPLNELQNLRELAELGDIQNLIDSATRIEAAEPRFRAFAQHLRQSARSFRINELRAFLNQLIEQ